MSFSPSNSGICFAPPTPQADLHLMLKRYLAARAISQLRSSAEVRRGLAGPGEWKAYAAGIRRRLAAALGQPRKQLRGRWRSFARSRHESDGFSIENHLVESLPGCWMNLTIWKPDPARWAPPWPAVVTPVGHNGKYFPSEQFPPQVFAANGLLTASFDPPGFGQKAAGNDHFSDGVRCYLGGQNSLAFFVADACRAVDCVLAREDVDPRPGVAMTGVSGGGFTSICCAVLDPRVTTIGPSCFGLPDEFHPILNGYAACPEYLWANRYSDGLGLVDLLIGARFVPMLLMGGKHDQVITAPHLETLAEGARAGYAAVGKDSAIRLLLDDCGHEYSTAQALAFVSWMRQWRGGTCTQEPPIRPIRLVLLPDGLLKVAMPLGLSMASSAKAAARRRSRPHDFSVVQAALAKLVPGLPTHRRRGLEAVGRPSGVASLWTHTLQELSLRDGRAWELPATLLRPSRGDDGFLIFFDDRGRWTSLQRGGWLTRVAGMFCPDEPARSVLTVDLPGWGETRPQPGPYDVVSWGGIDRWTAYVSAAVGESVMSLRLREAVRVIDLVQRKWQVPAARIIVAGFGLGANVAGLASSLHGRVEGALLVEPLAEFADLARASRSVWPHDAYFPGILQAVDMPAALALQPGRVAVVGPRDARGRLLGQRHRQVFLGRNLTVLPQQFGPEEEIQVISWLRTRPSKTL